MDNASKAIIIAGAVLIAVGLMSLFLVFFKVLREYNGAVADKQVTEDILSFNRFFTESLYDVNLTRPGTQIYGYDVYNLALKAFELSQRDDSYVVIIQIGSNSYSNYSTLDNLRNWLSTNNLNYANLSYEGHKDEAGVFHQDVTEEARNDAIGNFNKEYDYEIKKGNNSGYNIEGRVYSIKFNKVS